jgi:cytochrome P450
VASASSDVCIAPEQADRYSGYVAQSTGDGISTLFGAPLARYEGRVALDALLERLPGIRLAPGQVLQHHPHFFLRGLRQLVLEWDVA